MNPRTLRPAVAGIAAGLLLLAGASAHAVVLSTADNRFDVGVDNQGWWGDAEAGIDSNDNYLIGHTGTGLGIVSDHRAFFTFDASLLTGTALSATLQLTRGGSSTLNEANETIELFDVSTDAATLNDNSSLDLGIYADLGSGTSYGSFVVSGSGSTTDVILLTLNGAGLADLNAATGFFSIGATLTSDNGDDGIFGSSQVFTATLDVTTAAVPEPATAALLALGLLAGGAGGLRRSRRR